MTGLAVTLLQYHELPSHNDFHKDASLFAFLEHDKWKEIIEQLR